MMEVQIRIITLTPAESEDPASEPPPVPSVPHQATIDALETLLYSLRSDRNTSQLEEKLQRERRRIEGYEKAKQTQRRITKFLHHS